MDSPRDNEHAIDAGMEPRSRRDLLRSGGLAAIAGLLGVFGVAGTTSAKNGDAVRAGDKTTASRPTTIESSKGPALQARATSKTDPIGLRGVSNAAKGIGVQGSSQAADGIAGQFVAGGGGTAVEADGGKQGVALRTKGRVELKERSGSATVSEGGAEFVIPVSGGLSDRSIVLATLQDHRPGIHVEAAYVLDAEEGFIVVRLNQAVAEQTKVGWVVLD